MSEAKLTSQVTPSVLDVLNDALAAKSAAHEEVAALTVVIRFVEVLVGKSSEPLERIFAEEAELNILGPASMIWAGHTRGRAQVISKLIENFSHSEYQIPEIKKLITTRHEVVALLRERGKLTGGQEYDVHGVMIWTIRDGQIASVVEMVDDAAQLTRPESLGG